MVPPPPRERGRRRFLLSAAGAAGLTSVVAGCFEEDSPEETEDRSTDTPRTPSATATETEPSFSMLADQFGTAIDVAAAGVSPDGMTAVQPVIDGELGDDTLLYFPEGRYLFEDAFDFSSLTQLAIVGDGATIELSDGFTSTLFFGNGTKSLHIEGLTIDSTGKRTGPRPINVRIRDELVVDDVLVKGSSRSMQFDVTSPSGTGTIRRMRMPDGGLDGEWAVGCLVSPNNRGEIRFDNCQIAGFPNNGLYASPSRGPVRVNGGTYANNNRSNVRVSGPATVRNVTVVLDRAPQNYENQRGLWLRGGRCIVENCEIVLSNVEYSGGGIVTGAVGTIRDTRIRVEPDGTRALTVVTDDDSSDSAEDGDYLHCRNVDVVGSAANGSSILVRDRNNCTFEQCRIVQPGPDRDGITFIRSDGSVVRDTAIDVTGKPVRVDDSDVTVNNVSVAGSSTSERTRSESG